MLSTAASRSIVVTHDVGQARRLAHDIVFLHHGRIIEHQPAKSFFDQPDSDVARPSSPAAWCFE